MQKLVNVFETKAFIYQNTAYSVITITQNGNTHAVHISGLFADMETGLRDWDSKGVLRIGASITIGSQFLPVYVKAFSKLCPEIDVKVIVEQSDRLEQKLLTNTLDFALIEEIVHDPNIVSEAYMEDHLSIIASPKMGWKQGQFLSQKEFISQRFLLREQGSGTRELKKEMALCHPFFELYPIQLKVYGRCPGQMEQKANYKADCIS